MPVRAWLKGAGCAGLAAAVIGGLGAALLRCPGGLQAALLGLALGACGLLGLLLCWMYLPQVDLPGRSPCRGPRAGRRLALTFDDGPNGADTEAILETLKAHGARATFFCVGARAAAQQALVRRIAAEGHLIGNHTHEHRKLPWLGRAAIARQLDEAQAAIAGCGVPPPRWFRAPHGFKSPLLPRLLRARGLRLCGWSHGVWDTDRPGAQAIERRARRHLRPGEILLLHDGGGDRGQTAAALGPLLVECARLGLAPVTLDELW